MPYFIGLDVGDKRVGVAIADSTVRIATPHDTFIRERGLAEARILKLIEEKQISEIVVGLPLTDAGEDTPQAEKVRNFCRRLERRAAVKVHYIDENSTSFEAEQRLNSVRRGSSKERGMIDAVAATIILQNFLDVR